MSGLRLTLNNIYISLRGQRLLQLNTVVESGATLTVMGPSGVGKSSLLAYIAGFLAPDFEASGEIYLGERETSACYFRTRCCFRIYQWPRT